MEELELQKYKKLLTEVAEEDYDPTTISLYSILKHDNELKEEEKDLWYDLFELLTKDNPDIDSKSNFHNPESINTRGYIYIDERKEPCVAYEMKVKYKYNDEDKTCKIMFYKKSFNGIRYKVKSDEIDGKEVDFSKVYNSKYLDISRLLKDIRNNKTKQVDYLCDKTGIPYDYHDSKLEIGTGFIKEYNPENNKITYKQKIADIICIPNNFYVMNPYLKNVIKDKDEVIAITKRIKIKINELKYELKCVYKKVRKEELKELKKEKSLVKDKKTSKH